MEFLLLNFIFFICRHLKILLPIAIGTFNRLIVYKSFISDIIRLVSPYDNFLNLDLDLVIFYEKEVQKGCEKGYSRYFKKTLVENTNRKIPKI